MPEPALEPAPTVATPTNGPPLERVHEVLAEWGRRCNLDGPPDDAICAKILAAAGGIEAFEFKLGALRKSGKRPTTSYGWFEKIFGAKTA